MYELFIKLTEELFWKGYTQQVAESDTKRFTLEINEFLNTYSN